MRSPLDGGLPLVWASRRSSARFSLAVDSATWTRRGAFSWPRSRTTRATLPGAPAACELILGHVRARLADRGVRRLRRGRRLLHRDVAADPARARGRPDVGAAEPLRRGLRPVRARGRAAGGPRGGAARDGRLRHHRRRAGGRRPSGGPRRGDHRSPSPGRRAAGLHRRTPGAGRLRLPGAVRLGRRAEAERGAVRRRRPRSGRGAPRTSTSPRSPRSATSCRCAARTGASCARGSWRSGAPAGRACAR